MDVWLQNRDGESLPSRLVSSPQQATPMSQNDIREAMHGAKKDYPDYAWEMESGFKSGEFVLHGHSK